MKFKLGDKDICPLLERTCIEHSCKWYKQLAGVDPNTGHPVDHFDCSIGWGPVLLIEMAQKINQMGAEISKLRSEVSKTVIKVEDPPLALSEKKETLMELES